VAYLHECCRNGTDLLNTTCYIRKIAMNAMTGMQKGAFMPFTLATF